MEVQEHMLGKRNSDQAMGEKPWEDKVSLFLLRESIIPTRHTYR